MKAIMVFLAIFLISLTSALPVCSDTNQQDISKVPCTGLTIPLNCSGNVTAFNMTNTSINFSFQTFAFIDDIYNFTMNLTRGNYQLIDCGNNTALIEIKLVEQGFGINLLGIIIPSILLSMICLFISGRMFNRFAEEDEEKQEHLSQENDMESFVPRNRLLPLVFMLFSFIPMIFMVGFVGNHLEQYLPGANVYVSFEISYDIFTYCFFPFIS